jgi:hypothetical protein
VTCNHAVAIKHTAFERILDEMPPLEDATFDEWIERYRAFDQYLPRRVKDGVFTAIILWPRVATQPELRNYDEFDRELADRYTV